MLNGFLRQATASQTRQIGPFLDDTDFITPATGLTIANTDIILNGTAKNSGGGTHEDNGMYSVAFDATDTATVGELAGSVVVADALPVYFKFVVVEEAVYDALFAASAPGFATVAALATVDGIVDDILVDTAEIGTAGAGLTAINLPNQTMDIVGNITGNLSGSVGSVTGGATAAALADVQTDVDTIVAAIDATGAADLDAIKAKTDALPGSILTTALTESYAADGAAGTLSQILFAIQQMLQEKSVSSTTMTVKKLDGSTTAMTFTLNNATNPTSITRAS